MAAPISIQFQPQVGCPVRVQITPMSSDYPGRLGVIFIFLLLQILNLHKLSSTHFHIEHILKGRMKRVLTVKGYLKVSGAETSPLKRPTSIWQTFKSLFMTR